MAQRRTGSSQQSGTEEKVDAGTGSTTENTATESNTAANETTLQANPAVADPSAGPAERAEEQAVSSDRAENAQETSQETADEPEVRKAWRPLQATLNADQTKEPGEDALVAKPEVRADRAFRGVGTTQPDETPDRKILEGLHPATVSAQLHAQVRQMDTTGLSGNRSDIAAAAVVFQHPARNEHIRNSQVSQGEGQTMMAKLIPPSDVTKAQVETERPTA